MNDDDEFVEVSVELHARSEKAVLVFDGDVEDWVALSLLSKEDRDVLEDAEIGDTITISIPQWVAEDKGFV